MLLLRMQRQAHHPWKIIKSKSFQTNNFFNKICDFRPLPNSKFRPVPMQAVSETAPPFQSNLSAPVVVGGDDDVRD